MADRRLQVFHAVAKHLSFTKAAETLFMTQPAVTFQIKQLEEHLNTRLFDRAQGRIALTPAGHVALEYAERILALSAELDTRLKEMGGQAAGPLLIGASMTIGEYVLPQLIGKFKSRFPAVVPTLFVGNSEAVQDRVAERSLDLGFIEGDSHLASLHSELCCEDEHRLAGGEIEAVAEAAREEAYVLVRLAAIRLEVQWQLAIGLAYASLRRGGCWRAEADEGGKQYEDGARRDKRVPGHNASQS